MSTVIAEQVDLAPLLVLARRHLDCDASGIAVRGRAGAAVTLASSAPLVDAADALQASCADGPAVSPAWPTAQVLVHDVREPNPWPTWTRSLAEVGILGILANQIVSPPDGTGSLTLFFRRRLVLGPQQLALASLLARQAGEALHQAREVTQLHTAIEGRTSIGQAQGILMERFGLTPDQAFAVLVRRSQETNTRLQLVAQELVRTGSLEPHAVDEP